MHLCGLARIAFFGSLLLCASLTPSNQSREGRKVTGISRHFGTKFAEQLYRATGLSLTPLPSPPLPSLTLVDNTWQGGGGDMKFCSIFFNGGKKFGFPVKKGDLFKCGDNMLS